MKIIPLTKGKAAFVDNKDFELVSSHKWKAVKRGYTYYAESTSAGPSMHRLIMDAKRGQLIDHKNGNGLDNRRRNLRFATQAQNVQNGRAHRDSTSKYRGVCWDLGRRKWSAQICFNHKKTKIGFFDNEIEAAKAYDLKAKELFGEFARLNF
jgi:hypothetical protein